MAELKYVGSSVNSAVSELTTLAARFQPLSSTIQTKTGVMIGCKGFNLIGSAGSDVFSGSIVNCEQMIAGLVGDVRRTQASILDYSQDQNDINAFIDSLSANEYYALNESGALAGFDKKISGRAKAGFLFHGGLATLGAFGLGFVEGVGNFVEGVGDDVILFLGGAASVIADVVGADEFANAASEWTRATVAYDVTGNAFDSLYANTEFGQYVQNNSTVFDEARGLGNGIGYATGVIAANALFPGVGMAGFAAAAGFGNAAERSFSDGATLGEGFVYSAASAGWEAVQWTVGSKIAGVGIPGASQLTNAALRVGLDGIDSGLEGFVQPGLTMIYKDYPGETFAEQYGAAFQQNGGWDTVWTQFVIGSSMSAVSEGVQVFKSKTGKGKKSADTKTETKAEADAKTDTKADAKTDTKADANADTKADAKTDTKADAKTDTKADAKTDAKTDTKADAKTDVKTDAKTNSDVGSTKNAGDSGSSSSGSGSNGPTSYTDTTVGTDGVKTTTTLDSDANITNQTNEYSLSNKDGTTSHVTENVDANGNITGYTDTTVGADGVTTTTTLDANGNVSSSSKEYKLDNGDGTSTHVTETYDGNGNITGSSKEYTITNADGTTSHVTETFDAKGNQTGYTDTTVGTDGVTTTTTLDGDANVTGQTNEYTLNNKDGTISKVTETVDADGKITEYTDSTLGTDGVTTTTTLDSDANVTGVKQEYDIVNADGTTSHITETYNGDPNVKPDVDVNKPGLGERLGSAARHIINGGMPNSIIADEATDTIVEGKPHGMDTAYVVDTADDTFPSNSLGLDDLGYTEPTGDDIQYREDISNPPGGPVNPPSGPVNPPVNPPENPINPDPINPPVDPPVNPIIPDPINPPVDPPVNPINPDPVNPAGPYGGETGHSGSGFGGGNDEFNGAAFSLDEEFGDDFDSIADIIANGSKFGTIPSSASPLRASGGGVSAFIPISAGLSAAAAVGLGTKAFLDKKNKSEEEELDELDELDDDLENWEFDVGEDESFDEDFDDDSFLPEELLED